MASTASERRAPLVADGLAALTIALAGVSAVVLFLPAEGFIAEPLRAGLGALLGRSAFVLPPVLLLVGILRLMRVALPVARLVGLGMLLVAVLAAEHMLAAGDAGILGRWLADGLVGAVGGVGTAITLLIALGLGAGLTFGMRLGPK
jgi:hypothetical protein